MTAGRLQGGAAGQPLWDHMCIVVHCWEFATGFNSLLILRIGDHPRFCRFSNFFTLRFSGSSPACLYIVFSTYRRHTAVDRFYEAGKHVINPLKYFYVHTAYYIFILFFNKTFPWFFRKKKYFLHGAYLYL